MSQMDEQMDEKPNIKKVAKLARLEISDVDLPGYERDILKIVDLFDKLKEVDVKGVQPLTSPADTTNVFRDDVPRPSLPKEEALKNAPEASSDYFIVPKVVE